MIIKQPTQLTKNSAISVCGNTHAQLTTWYGSANHSDNDENIHDKVTSQIAAVDLNSSTLMVRNLCDRHHILKDNSWMCILHQYHKAIGLQDEYLSLSYMYYCPAQYITFFFSWGSCCHERICNNYVEIQWKSMQVSFIIFLCI